MDIFDSKKIEAIDTAIKWAVRAAALVAVASMMSGKLKDAAKELASNAGMMEQMEEGVDALILAGESFDPEGIVYRTVCLVASQEGAPLVTPGIAMESFTAEEREAVARIAEGVEFCGESEEEVLASMEDREYLAMYYGPAGAEAIFGLVDAHLEEWR